jgi:hypothetical protein
MLGRPKYEAYYSTSLSGNSAACPVAPVKERVTPFLHAPAYLAAIP